MEEKQIFVDKVVKDTQAYCNEMLNVPELKGVMVIFDWNLPSDVTKGLPDFQWQSREIKEEGIPVAVIGGILACVTKAAHKLAEMVRQSAPKEKEDGTDSITH